MNNDGTRGWVFRNMGTGNVASISAGGVATFNSSVYFTNYLYGNSKQALDTTDSYLRLNQANQFSSGIYTPYNFRADGTIYVAGTTYYINGSTSNLNNLTLR